MTQTTSALKSNPTDTQSAATTETRDEKLANLDAEYASYLDNHPDMPSRWLLAQTLLTARERRMMLDMIQFQPGWRVLDAGSGFGQIPLEIAASVPIRAVGVDTDPGNLRVAARVAERLGGTRHLCDGASVELTQASVYDLPIPSNTFDLVICRFVYQHLGDPQCATTELYRVLREGGQLLVMDIDDQFSITYPQNSNALTQLQSAFARLQADNGGDRFVGRKLSGYLAQAGFQIAATMLWPQSAHTSAQDGSASRLFELERLSGARDEIVSRGIMGAHDFDHYVNEYASEDPTGQFSCNAQVIALGRKPALDAGSMKR